MDVHGHTKTKGPYYLFLDKTLYDVTDFLPKHPGGSILRTMAWTKDDPIDATLAFRQFHYRAMELSDRIAKIIKCLPLAPEELQVEARNELVYNVRKDPRRQRSLDMIKDYEELTEKLKKEGFFEGSTLYVIKKWIINLWFFWLGLWICKNVNWFFGAVFLGVISQSIFWFAGHESLHYGFSTVPWLDKLFQYIFMDFFFGASTRFWTFQHNYHHANTQHRDYDVDLHYYPYVYLSQALFHAPGHPPGGEKGTSWWIRNQGITMWPGLLFLQFSHGLVYHIKYNLFKKTYEYFFLGFVLHYCFHYMILNYFCGFSLIKSIITMNIYLNFCGSAIFFQSWFSHAYMNIHTGCPPVSKEEEGKVPRYHYNWIELNALHTVNVPHSLFVDLFCGFLSCQVQHHLWPAMPERHHGEYTKKLVKDFFERHGLVYYEQPYFACWMTVWKTVIAVGKGLPSPGPFNQLHR